LNAAIANDQGIERIMVSATLGSRLLPQLLHDKLIAFISDALSHEAATALLEGFDWDFAYSESDEKRTNYARRAASRLRGARILHVKAMGEHSSATARTDLLLARALALYDPEGAAQCLDSLDWLPLDESMPTDTRNALVAEVGRLRAHLKTLV
jgi:hypothetical protein